MRKQSEGGQWHSSGSSSKKPPAKSPVRATPKQGQYLAYCHLYRKLHRQGPSESDIAEYFRVSAPSVHQMVIKLEEHGFITREPGVARSIRVTLPPDEIPDLAGDAEPEVKEQEPVQTKRRAGSTQLYTLQVCLIGGPVPESFANKTIRRDIQIRGDQTLEVLHHTIFQAFDRWDEHYYEFQFGKGPQDKNGKRYVLPEMLEDEGRGPTIAGDLTRTTIDALALKVDQSFGYWFDYGDDWWHQIDVEAIDQHIPKGRFPKVVKRVGKSPPQYLDADE